VHSSKEENQYLIVKEQKRSEGTLPFCFLQLNLPVICQYLLSVPHQPSFHRLVPQFSSFLHSALPLIFRHFGMGTIAACEEEAGRCLFTLG